MAQSTEIKPYASKLYRSVSTRRGDRPDREMDLIGLVLIGLLLILILPMLPVIAAVWGLLWLGKSIRGQNVR